MIDRLPLYARCVLAAKRLLERGGCHYTDDPVADGRFRAEGSIPVERMAADQLAEPPERVIDALRCRGFTPKVAARWWAEEVDSSRPPPIVSTAPAGQSSRRMKAQRARWAVQHARATEGV